MWKDAKYLIAYLLPLTTFAGVVLGGWYALSGFVLAFVFIPVIEILLPANPSNVAEGVEASRSKRVFFDLLLWLNLPIVYGTVGFLAYRVAMTDVGLGEAIAMTLSVGIVVGTSGINVAHELGHRESAFEQFIARLLLVPACYSHFTIEHNFGHHKEVGTPTDPATAKYGESLYRFWVRCISGTYSHAWEIQKKLLSMRGHSFWDISKNAVLQGTILQVVYIAIVFWLFGLAGLLAALGAGLIGVLLLESVNYIEHYGLKRDLLPSGRYEPLNPSHSWNSDHELGRIFLYELTRHSDHHFKSTRKYQILRHLDESPQLPYGYPASIILALFPSLWMSLTHPRIKQPATQ